MNIYFEIQAFFRIFKIKKEYEKNSNRMVNRRNS
jgi:hypothetical protein